eukprot:gene11999-25144_t
MNSAPQYGQWLNILKWSLTQTDGTSDSSNLSPMSQENKEWLTTAMKELIKDEASRLLEITKEFISIIDSGTTDSQSEHIKNLLEEVHDIVEQIDMAQIFVKYGGTKCLIAFINCNSSAEDVSALAASVIGTMSQNNLKVQEDLYTQNVVSQLQTSFIETKSDIMKNKILYALSCIIRSHPASEQQFTATYTNTLQDAISSSSIQLQRRGLFLLSALLQSDFLLEEHILLLMNIIIPNNIQLLSNEDADIRESILNLLYGIISKQKLRDYILQYKVEVQCALDSLGTHSRYTDVEYSHEKDLLENVQRIFLNPPPLQQNNPPLPPSYDTSSNANNSTSSIVEVDVESSEPTPMLMLAPPPLSAASIAP